MNAILKPSLYEQLIALPEHITGEILNGELHAMPRPSGKQGLAESVLNIRIGTPFGFGEGGPGCWRVIIEPEVHFIRDTEVAVPDFIAPTLWRGNAASDAPASRNAGAL
jgi:hypothetical protein